MRGILAAILLFLPMAAQADLVYRAEGEAVERLSPLRALAPALPDDRLVIDPGFYRWQGANYDLTRGGLYRFVDPPHEAQQRIVWDGDLDRFMSAVSWIVTHGNADAGLSDNDLSYAAMNRKLFLICADLAGWAIHLLDYIGIQGRLVWTLTLDEWNGYDNGHTMVEAFDPARGKWVLYDLSLNHRFTDAEGRALDLLEMIEAVTFDDYEIVTLSADAQVDVGRFAAQGYRFEMFSEYVMAGSREWYARVLQVPIVREGSVDYFTSDVEVERILRYTPTLRRLSYPDFTARFYAD